MPDLGTELSNYETQRAVLRVHELAKAHGWEALHEAADNLARSYAALPRPSERDISRMTPEERGAAAADFLGGKIGPPRT